MNVDDTTTRCTSNINNSNNSTDDGIDISPPVISNRIASDFGSVMWSFEEIEKSFSIRDIERFTTQWYIIKIMTII